MLTQSQMVDLLVELLECTPNDLRVLENTELEMGAFVPRAMQMAANEDDIVDIDYITRGLFSVALEMVQKTIRGIHEGIVRHYEERKALGKLKGFEHLIVYMDVTQGECPNIVKDTNSFHYGKDETFIWFATKERFGFYHRFFYDALTEFYNHTGHEIQEDGQ
jgi:hypothetical protein